jgi:endonuclease G, mitochondrial
VSEHESAGVKMAIANTLRPLTKCLDRWKWVGFLSCLVVLAIAPMSQARNYGSMHLLMGTPSSDPDSTNSEDYLRIKRQYALSYNSSKGTANWVSWQLNATWIGGIDRCKSFSSDPTLPRGFKVVVSNDYTNSGFSRGHMTRSGDRTLNPTDNCATFLMTNIVPQTQDNNEGPWLELENLSKELALAGKDLYIIAGPSGAGATGLSGFKTEIGKNKVTVPSRLWKIVVVIDQPGLRLAGITTSTRVIAVNMPNEVGIQRKSYKDYLTTVDALETLTGYDFLSELPKDIQAAIEAKKDGE